MLRRRGIKTDPGQKSFSDGADFFTCCYVWESETSVLDKLYNYLNHVLIQQKYSQLVGHFKFTKAQEYTRSVQKVM